MRFVIFAPSFTYESGGVLALHMLAGRLNALGHDASLWPDIRPRLFRRSTLRHARQALGFEVRNRRTFDTGPFDTRLATYADLRGAVVVYPETVSGNPLHADRVVRWLLNKPGFFTGKAGYSPGDLFFYFMQAFDDAIWNAEPDNELCLTWTHPAYVDTPHGARDGTCHMVRKGAERGLPTPSDSLLLDGLSHEETAEAFRRSERFVCFDLYTRYALYAALCGCLPIVVPNPALSEADWMPDPEDRYGVAYGEANIPWAIATRDRLRERLTRQAAREDMLLRRFVDKCRSHFGS